MAPLRYVPPHKRGEWRAAAAGGGMEPEEEIAEAEFGEQRRLGTARRVSARTPRADSVRCRREVRIATVPGFFPPAEEECWETDSESDGWVTDDEEPDDDCEVYADRLAAAHDAGDDELFAELVLSARSLRATCPVTTSATPTRLSPVTPPGGAPPSPPPPPPLLPFLSLAPALGISAIGVGIRAACGRRAAAWVGTRVARRRGAVCGSRAR